MSDSHVRLDTLAVVMLGVTDLPRSVAFYRDVLGLRPQGEVAGEFAFFDAGGVMLALSVPHARSDRSPHLVGATEIVFRVESVAAAHEALLARGVPFAREPRQVAGDNWSAVFTDPDGHRLSVFGRA
jgi:catechol 2,3-dioxygenase-like lactoylglutathione lyase family enzyme